MQLIELTTPQAKPEAERIAESLLFRVNASLAERIHEHQSGFTKFWDSSETPDAILAAMGSHAALFLASASENVDHIGRLAAVIGKTVVDFLPLEYWMPRRTFVVNMTDGTATLAAPADGYDAWGREIPATEPEPEPEPEP